MYLFRSFLRHALVLLSLLNFQQRTCCGLAAGVGDWISSWLDDDNQSTTKTTITASASGAPEQGMQMNDLPSFVKEKEGGDSKEWWKMFVLSTSSSSSSSSVSDWIWKVVTYKPPVGITAMYVIWSILVVPNQKSIQTLLLQQQEQEEDIPQSTTKTTRERYSSDLDTLDRDYDLFGGVHSVRAQLLQRSLQKQSPRSRKQQLVQQALSISALPRSSRTYFLQRTARALSVLSSMPPATVSTTDDDERLVKEGVLVVQVRALDACLRLLRDRLLTSATRLYQLQSLWEFRVNYYHQTRVGKLIHFIFRKPILKATLEKDRQIYQLTTATLQQEMIRLGQVQQLLLQQPSDLTSSYLLSIHSDDDTVEQQQPYHDENFSSSALLWTQQAQTLVQQILMESMMVESSPNQEQTDEEKALQQSQLEALSQWSGSNYNLADNKNGRTTTPQKSWDTVIHLVENLCRLRKKREQTYYHHLKKTTTVLSNIRNKIKLKLDTYRIPSSALLMLASSFGVHKYIYLPYWSSIVDFVKNVVETVWGIVEFRFYNPARDILIDLFSTTRRSKLLDESSFLSLENEQESLDNMLRDLGVFSDDTDRMEALDKATRMYEKQLANGVIGNMLRGNIVRLLLIQIQQLKAGMLQAMGSIDELVDSNRLNVQLLAAIPAFLLVSLGTKIFFSILVAIRSSSVNSKQIRGVSTIHDEMSNILSRMEKSLLLSSTMIVDESISADNDANKKRSKSTENQNQVTFPDTQQQQWIGEFLLYAHSYLLLLNYITPPIQKSSADYIHHTLQDLFRPQQQEQSLEKITKQQLALLQLISAKHAELAKLF